MSRLDAETLRASVAALIGDDAAAAARFGIAVSGGVDSMALLLLARDAFPGRIMAASVDHAIRPAAPDECRHVAAVAAALGVPHATLGLDHVPGSQAAARQARYDRLLAWRATHGLDWLLTAHHADDQLETMVMRINRGSGIAGLAGIRQVREDGVLRPLLPFRRSALETVVAAAGIATVDDPSNRDCRYDRARLRARMAGQDFIDPVAAAHTASNLAQATEAIAWSIARLVEQHCHDMADGCAVRIEGLPLLYRHLLIERVIEKVGGKAPRGGRVEANMRHVYAGQKVSIAGCTVEIAPDEPMRVLIRRAPPRRGD